MMLSIIWRFSKLIAILAAIHFSLNLRIHAAETAASSDTVSKFAVIDHGPSLDMLVDGRLVTTYHKASGRKPILWPVLSPRGGRLTRDFPMLDTTEGEIRDHLHHRSIWLTHGEVNDVNFWAEEGKNLGTVLHQEVDTVRTDETSSSISGVCDWIDSGNKIILKEKRSVSLSKFESAFVLQFDSQLSAQDETVELGDTKEGTFGIRVAESIRVEAGKGGRILDSEGRINDQAWGQSANWVDYSGPVLLNASAAASSESEKSTAGMTVFYHPDSFRFPGRWHVRGYGLFAHNPIGEKDFLTNNVMTQQGRSTTDSTTPQPIAGGYEMKPHETIRLKYSILLHDSDWTPEMAERYWKKWITLDN